MSHFEMDWHAQFAADHFFDIPNKWLDASPRNTPPDLLDVEHGTLIEMHLLHGRKFQIPSLVSDLEQAYAPGLRAGKSIRWFTVQKGRKAEDRQLSAPDVDTSGAEAVVKFDAAVDVLGETLPVRGQVSLDHNVPYSRSEISVGFGFRVIARTRDCYSSEEEGVSFHGTGVSGWVDLGEGWQTYLTTTKDAFNNDVAWDALMAFIFSQIRPLLEATEKAAHRMTFHEIEISLNAMLNADPKMVVDLPTEKELEPVEQEPEQSETEEKEEAEPEESEPPEDKDEPEGDKPAPEPAMANIEIVPMTDLEMDGTLCKIDVQRDFTIRALVNEEHETIQSALRERPTNRQALVSYIVHALAAAIVDNNDLLKRTFRRPKILRSIEQFQGRSREQFVLRLLVDLVRMPLEAQ